MTDDTDTWYGPETATFGDRLTAAREAAGLERADLAKRLGVRKSTLREWEDDLSEPRANRLSMLAGLLNVSIVWLLTGEGEGGLDPQSEADLPADGRAMLTELAALRSELRATADRAARLEKRLRRHLQEGGAA